MSARLRGGLCATRARRARRALGARLPAVRARQRAALPPSEEAAVADGQRGGRADRARRGRAGHSQAGRVTRGGRLKRLANYEPSRLATNSTGTASRRTNNSTSAAGPSAKPKSTRTGSASTTAGIASSTFTVRHLLEHLDVFRP